MDDDTHPLPAAGDAASAWVLGGRYRVVDRVGSGGMSEVFRAHDELLERDVAVKVFKNFLDDPDSTLNGADRRELELQAMAQLNHPNLVTLYDGAMGGDGPSYLVLEFVDGPDLYSRLKEGPLPDRAVRDLGTQMADALAYVHAHGLVHRDVKPANILLGTDAGLPRARLSDFGIVRMIGRPQMTSVDLTVGTAYYIAPEQARGSSVGPEADVYALGLVLFEALTGRRAFDGPMHEALAARLTNAPAIPADLAAPWPQLLAAMTAIDPAERPDAAAVAAELRASSPTLAPLPPPVPVAAAVAPAEAVTAAVLAAPAMDDSGPQDSALVAPVIADPLAARRRRRVAAPALLLAALVVALAIPIGIWMMKGQPASAPGGTTTESTTPSVAATTSAKHSKSAHHDSTAPVANVHQTSRTHSSSAAPTKQVSTSAKSSAPTSSSPASRTATSSASTASSSPAASSSSSSSAPASSSASTSSAAADSKASPSTSPAP